MYPPRTRKNPSTERTALRTLARGTKGGVVSVDRAAALLGSDRRSASLLLGSLARRGWLKRLRRGFYILVPLETEPAASGIVEDPWLLAAELFSPCYIGGWSAAEHWGLTEQLFRSTFIVTASQVRRNKQAVGGSEFFVVSARASRVSSVGTVWRGRERVAVSNPERTIVDALESPAWLGGARHLAEIIDAYHRGKSWDPEKLADELNAATSGAASKRLGLILEALGIAEAKLSNVIAQRRTLGVVKLDPTVRGHGKLSKRWGLWVNVSIDIPEPT